MYIFFHIDRLYEVIKYSIKIYTTQNELGILEYGCRYACAWIYDTSQMKWFALFLGEQKYLQSTK